MATATTTYSGRLLVGLDDAQKAAALALDGPVMIVAGAGSGKTRVLTARVALLLDHGVEPSSIVCVTFTNMATTEMRERIRLCAGDTVDDIVIGTFHALCSRILREHGERISISPDFKVVAEEEARSIFAATVRRVGVNTREYSIDTLTKVIAEYKRSGLAVRGWLKRLRDTGLDLESVDTYYDVLQAYNNALDAHNGLDFGDLIAQTVYMFKLHPDILKAVSSKFRYVSVDEYQDTSAQAALLLQQLSSVHGNLCIVGDPRQSIYGFNGGNPKLIGTFARDHKGTKRYDLAYNYRSGGRIVACANSVMAHSQVSQGIAGAAKRPEPGIVEYRHYGNDEEESIAIAKRIEELVCREGYTYSDIAVIYRVKHLSHPLECGLLRAQIPYITSEKDNILNWPEIKCAVSYLKMLQCSKDIASALCVLSGIARRLDRTTEATIRASASSRGDNVCQVILEDDLQISGHALTALNKCRSVLSKLTLMYLPGEPLDVMLDYIIRHDLEYQCIQCGEEVGIARLTRLKEFASMVARDFGGSSHTTLTPFLKWYNRTSASEPDGGNGVKLLTIHTSKGLEFPVVFLIGLEEGILPYYKAFDDPETCEEERRLTYVAMTRAENALYVSSAERRNRRGRIITSEPSRFIFEALGS